MSQSYEVEVCFNAEWLVVFGGYGFGADGDCSQVEPWAGPILDARQEFLQSLPEVNLVPARGARATCHGWNGARFAWRDSEFGTFEQLPAELLERIQAGFNDIWQRQADGKID